jgi:hypothetical protein
MLNVTNKLFLLGVLTLNVVMLSAVVLSLQKVLLTAVYIFSLSQIFIASTDNVWSSG